MTSMTSFDPEVKIKYDRITSNTLVYRVLFFSATLKAKKLSYKLSRIT